MKYNVAEVASLQPDYLGFIFYGKSPRKFEGMIPEINLEIKKVGVFVNEELAVIVKKVTQYKLQIVQLHGDESTVFCKLLKKEMPTIKLWKVFSVGESFNFNELKPYEKIVDTFLFDTKGKNKGGNGVLFNWDILQNYPSQKPFILSGGISLKELNSLKKLIGKENSMLYAIDINSKFEDLPGKKNIQKLKQFIDEL